MSFFSKEEHRKISYSEVPKEIKTQCFGRTILILLAGVILSLVLRQNLALLFGTIGISVVAVLSQFYLIWEVMNDKIVYYDGTVDEISHPEINMSVGPKKYTTYGHSTIKLILPNEAKLIVPIKQSFNPSEKSIIRVYAHRYDLSPVNDNTYQISIPILVNEQKS